MRVSPHGCSRGIWISAALLCLVEQQTSAAFIPIFGGPAYFSTTGTGFLDQTAIAPQAVNDVGTAVVAALKYEGNMFRGGRGLRWDGSGSAAFELANPVGYSGSVARAINASGITVGYAGQDADNHSLGTRAVRWDHSGDATELDNLGGNASGYSYSDAVALNASGAGVGYTEKYEAGVSKGTRAVYWGGSTTTATELGDLGVDESGYAYSVAQAINDSGVVVGEAYKYEANNFRGHVAVRWDSSTAVATELASLGVSPEGYTFNRAIAINASGAVVGSAQKYEGGIFLNNRAVRWDSSSTAVTELENLGVDSAGITNTVARGISDSGTIVGFATKYEEGISKGTRAVRWDNSAVATELGNLGVDAAGFIDCRAIAINASDIAVGLAIERNNAGDYLDARAVYWGLENLAVDLNTLIDPSSGWLNLTAANDISDTGWVVGHGMFDPDGPGGNDAYDRMFLLNINAVPEPSTLPLLSLGMCALLGVAWHRKR